MAASKRQEIARPQSVARAGTRLNADTSSQPQGITRRVMLNILEAFFRRPVLHLLPLALMLALGLAFVVSGDKEYTSVGTLSVTNESLLADLTNAANTPGLTFETPASVTANQINELLRTDEFLSNVIDSAGLTPLIEGSVLTGQQVRSWIGANADGNSIVRVGATSQDPELSFRLADGTINSYREWVIDADVSQSTSTEESLQQRVTERESASQAADEAVRSKILENPEVPIEERPLVDQLDYERLQESATRAADQLRTAQDALDQARTQTEQASAIVAQRIRLLDEPEPAGAPAGRLRAAALTMIVFGVVGVMLSLATVVLSASLDHTIRVPNDVTARFGIDVLAVVPDFKH